MLLEPPPSQLDLKWRMLGIPTRVHPLFWLIAAVLGFGHETPKLREVLIWIACVFVSILIHEFGHALTARRLGARNLRVVLYHMGGLAISEGGISHKRRIVEILMGPGAGFLFLGLIESALLLAGYKPTLTYTQIETRYFPEILNLALSYLIQINFWWGLLNLIPVYPLDGGQVLQQILLIRKPVTGIELSHRLSIVVACLAVSGFLAFGIYQSFVDEDKHAFRYWLPVILFAVLAYVNHQLGKSQYLAASREAYLREPRQPWEQDPDWWKK